MSKFRSFRGSNWAVEDRGRSKWRRRDSEWNPGWSVDQWLQIRFTLLRSKIWIRIKVKSGIRIRIKVMRIRNHRNYGITEPVNASSRRLMMCNSAYIYFRFFYMKSFYLWYTCNQMLMIFTRYQMYSKSVSWFVWLLSLFVIVYCAWCFPVLHSMVLNILKVKALPVTYRVCFSFLIKIPGSYIMQCDEIKKVNAWICETVPEDSTYVLVINIMLRLYSLVFLPLPFKKEIGRKVKFSVLRYGILLFKSWEWWLCYCMEGETSVRWWYGSDPPGEGNRRDPGGLRLQA